MRMQISLSSNNVSDLLTGLLMYSPDEHQGAQLTTVVNALSKQYGTIFGNAHMSGEKSVVLKDYYWGDDRGSAYFAAIYWGVALF